MAKLLRRLSKGDPKAITLDLGDGTSSVIPMAKELNGSFYFKRDYTPTHIEIEEMKAIIKNLLNANENEDEFCAVVKLDEDHTTNETTKDAIKTIFFPTARQPKSVYLKSDSVSLYAAGANNEQQYYLMLFSRGFVFSRIVNQASQVTVNQKAKKPWVKFARFNAHDQAESKIFKAFLLSDVNRIEILDVWESRDIQQHLNGDKALARSGRAFAIFTFSEKYPIVVLCRSKEDVSSFMDVFRMCVAGQKNGVLSRNRPTVERDGIVFGINNTVRSRNSFKSLKASTLDWSEKSEFD